MGNAPRIGMLLGRPPRPGTVLAQVIDHLTGAGAQVLLVLPTRNRSTWIGWPPTTWWSTGAQRRGGQRGHRAARTRGGTAQPLGRERGARRHPTWATTAATISRELREIARQVGRTVRVELYGVDVLRTPSGPRVVDVNDFPGYPGVPGAASVLAAHLLGRASLG